MKTTIKVNPLSLQAWVKCKPDDKDCIIIRSSPKASWTRVVVLVDSLRHNHHVNVYEKFEVSAYTKHCNSRHVVFCGFHNPSLSSEFPLRWCNGSFVFFLVRDPVVAGSME